MAGTESGDQDHEAEERREEGRDSGGSCGESIGVDNLPVSGPSSAGVEITKKEEMVVIMDTETDSDTDVRLGGLYRACPYMQIALAMAVDLGLVSHHLKMLKRGVPAAADRDGAQDPVPDEEDRGKRGRGGPAAGAALRPGLVLSAVRAHARASGSLRQAAGEELLLLICGSKEQYRQLRDLRMSDETVLPFLHARQRRDAPRAAAAADCVLPPGQSGEAR